MTLIMGLENDRRQKSLSVTSLPITVSICLWQLLNIINVSHSQLNCFNSEWIDFVWIRDWMNLCYSLYVTLGGGRVSRLTLRTKGENHPTTKWNEMNRLSFSLHLFRVSFLRHHCRLTPTLFRSLDHPSVLRSGPSKAMHGLPVKILHLLLYQFLHTWYHCNFA